MNEQIEALKQEILQFRAENPDQLEQFRLKFISRKSVIADHDHDASCEKTQEKAKEKGDPNWKNACLDRDFVVVIKPTEEATYKNTVDILDEMTINAVKRFAMVKISDTERDLVKASEGQPQ